MLKSLTLASVTTKASYKECTKRNKAISSLNMLFRTPLHAVNINDYSVLPFVDSWIRVQLFLMQFSSIHGHPLDFTLIYSTMLLLVDAFIIMKRC